MVGTSPCLRRRASGPLPLPVPAARRIMSEPSLRGFRVRVRVSLDDASSFLSGVRRQFVVVVVVVVVDARITAD